MVPVDQNTILVGSEHGFFRMTEDSLVAFHTEADSILSSAPMYHSTVAAGGLVAIATFGAGVLFIDSNGRLRGGLDERHVLADDVVNFLYRDRQDGLWVATNNRGISRVDHPTPLFRYSQAHGLRGVIYDIAKTSDRLLIATGSGVFEMRTPKPTGYSSAFTQIAGIGQSWSLSTGPHHELVATDQGIFRLQKQSAVMVHPGPHFSIEKSLSDSDTYLAGSVDSYTVLSSHDSGSMEAVSLGLGSTVGPVRSAVQDRQGRVWLGTKGRGLLLSESVGSDIGLVVVRGLPTGGVVATTLLERPVAGSVGGIYGWDQVSPPQAPIFKRYEHFTTVGTSQDSLLTFTEDSSGRVWLVLADRVEIASATENNWVRIVPTILRSRGATIARIFVEESGVAWISRGDELFRYDPHVLKDYDIPYHTLVRRVSDLRTDSTLFGGTFANETGGFVVEQPAGMILDFAYDLNNLRFDFAAPTYNAPEETVFRYQLEGRDVEWSDWTKTPSASFSGLREGSYVFRVQAKNGFHQLGEIGTYSFRLLPPWYRTWWAYCLYLFGTFTLGAVSWKFVSMARAQREAEEQARELARERVINERLNEANDQLQVANVRLQEAVTLKDEFLATTSHELRTPITAILGYASILRDEIPGEYHEFVDIIEKSGERLMSTLNALLDLAKLRAGTMDVNIEEVDVGRLLARVVESRRLDANAKGLDLQFRIETPKALARTDEYAVRRIAENLLDNAMKFTEEGGVTVVVGGSADTIEIEFTDTGVGIDVEFLPILFDEFRQESGGLARSHSGNGLGLAIANRLAEMVNGSISVESTKNIGSTFTVVVPRDTVISSGEQGEPRPESFIAGDREPIRRGDGTAGVVREVPSTETAPDSP